ncbi:MAG: efflux RND transporter periplasmic adaptor subunit [Sandaracinaceae bacterium]|nr:efflux RND transporter periplasmic adaptor subunit [Sandaracinaceae bacterium]
MSIEKGARRVGWALMAAGVAVGVFVSTRREASATDGDGPRLEEVRVETVASATGQDVYVAHGVIRTAERAMASFVDGGRLVDRPVEVGDRVEVGQVLARLDPTPYRNAVRANDASRRELDLRSEQLARDRDRVTHLAADGVATTARVEQATSGFERVDAMRAAAGAQVAESRRRARDAVLRSPIAGVVTDVLVQPGELVAAGQPIARIAGNGGREVLLAVSVELAAQLSVGDDVRLRAVGVEAADPLSSTLLTGHVARVADAAASLGGLYPVVVAIDGDIRAGVGVEAELLGDPRPVLRVPLGAVLDPSGRRPFAWVVVDGRAERAWLRLGRLAEDRVEVLEGLAPGAQVVVRGHQHLLEGDEVRVGGAS